MNSDKLMKYDAMFEGKSLTFHVFRDKICVIAAELGAALGYADGGKGLPKTIVDDWGDEFIKGRDYDVLERQDLKEFKGLVKDTRGTRVSFAARLMVLYESGVDLVALKTEKELGKKLRRLLADEVLPKLRRGESIPGTSSPAASYRPQLLDPKVADLLLADTPSGRAWLLLQLAQVAQQVGMSSSRIEGYLEAAGALLMEPKKPALPSARAVPVAVLPEPAEAPPKPVQEVIESMAPKVPEPAPPSPPAPAPRPLGRLSGRLSPGGLPGIVRAPQHQPQPAGFYPPQDLDGDGQISISSLARYYGVSRQRIGRVVTWSLEKHGVNLRHDARYAVREVIPGEHVDADVYRLTEEGAAVFNKHFFEYVQQHPKVISELDERHRRGLFRAVA
ncbi:hypothetical protein KEG38_20615 [Polyangium jinanense]|uniref:hypothetical protein n=1 Tax=Polyangium jinanense TaxID=2829994 RepID=UPI002341F3EA|nr:hypothetical protein [Polyangium jinanense]MDC3956276.1 hypothetical protein [Polyangium jinanense]